MIQLNNLIHPLRSSYQPIFGGMFREQWLKATFVHDVLVSRVGNTGQAVEHIANNTVEYAKILKRQHVCMLKVSSRGVIWKPAKNRERMQKRMYVLYFSHMFLYLLRQTRSDALLQDLHGTRVIEFCGGCQTGRRSRFLFFIASKLWGSQRWKIQTRTRALLSF